MENSIQFVSVSRQVRLPLTHQVLVKLHMSLVLGSEDF